VQVADKYMLDSGTMTAESLHLNLRTLSAIHKKISLRQGHKLRGMVSAVRRCSRI